MTHQPELRSAEQKQALFAAIVEGSDSAIISTDLGGRILSWNHAAERTYGWPAKEAAGQHISLIVPPDLLAEHQHYVATVAAGGVVRRVETQRLTRDGARIPVAFTLSPVHDTDGTVFATSAITRDMSEQAEHAETLEATRDALVQAISEARAAEERSRAFLSDAAHQLRTPLAGIRGCAELLLRGALEPEERDKLLATMVRETARSARLITGLLRMARIDSGEELPCEPVDVVAICTDEVERVRLRAPQLEMTVSGDRTAIAAVDVLALREVVANLLDNARRFAISSVEVRTSTIGDSVEVRVTNDGPGVATDERGRIFERFVTLDGAGSGLGLAIARGLARAMGGDLDYDGSFVLRLSRPSR
jgi:PAS domain S-box-containing protein